MLNQQTLEKLRALRLHGMAEAFRAQSEQTGINELSFEERFALLVDQQWNWRQNRALQRRLTNAKLRHRASVEDLDFRTPRGRGKGRRGSAAGRAARALLVGGIGTVR